MLEKLNTLANESDSVQNELQLEYNKVFNDSTVLKELVSKLESSQEYGLDEYGEIYAWVRANLSDFQDCQAYLSEWFSEQCIRVDFKNDAIMALQGETLNIQDDSRHKRDNGVWLNHDQVIPEFNYTEHDGEINIAKRNQLIEEYMKDSGYFPGVFRVDQHGNVFLVNTIAKD